MSDDINQWLNDLGLSKYEKLFADNEIGLDILPELTQEDYQEIGIPLGDRKRLMKATQSLKPQSDETQSEDPSPAPKSDADRRQLTVMFCDLVDSTALSTRLDPEDMREILVAYQNICTTVVERFGGFVAKYMGDGVLIYFGYPQAYEDNAERAIRAGLGIVDEISGFEKPGSILAVRVGIATGTVVVGDLIGEGASEEAAIVGETPNLAARLQELAKPNTVVVGPRTHRLSGSLFESRKLSARNLKGFDKQIEPWLIVRSRRSESRFDAARPEHLTKLIGRDEEVETLLRRWSQAKRQEGRIALISGEAGIGKSRLVETLQERIAGDPHITFRLQCSPFHTTSALYPVADLLERSAGFAPSDTNDDKLDKLEALVRIGKSVELVVPLLAALLSIPTGERILPLDMSPQKQKELTLNMFVERFINVSRMHPVLFICEDAHWIDPTTLELLELIAQRVPEEAQLFIVTYRSEFIAPWIGRPRVTSMMLNRLDHRHGSALVDNITSGKSLPKEVLEQISAKADGVPLFVEELTKSIMESDFVREENDGYLLTGPLPALAIPETLQDSLMARLDRRASAKETAQIGAAIGREFSYGLLTSLSSLSEIELKETLDQLVDAGLILSRGSIPDSIYQFRHALVQDTAYGSILRNRRKELHEKIAHVLENEFPIIVETEPEILAFHYTEADIKNLAIENWMRAGKRSSDHSANLEATAQFTKALEIVETLPESRERDVLELDLQIDLFSPLMAEKGYHSQEFYDAQSRALELCEQLDDTLKILPILHSRYTYYQGTNRPIAALEYSEEYLRRAKLLDSDTARMIGNRAVGASLWHLGKLSQAREHIEKTIELYNIDKHRDLTSTYGQDIKVTAHTVYSVVLWSLGFPERALKAMDEGLEHARSINHPESLAFLLGHCALILNFVGRDKARARAIIEELSSSDRHSGGKWRGFIQFQFGQSLFEEGNRDEGLEEMKRSMGPPDDIKLNFVIPAHAVLLAEALIQLGDTKLALRYLDCSQALTDETEDRWSEAEIHRVRGDALLASNSNNCTEAESCYYQAMEIAQNQEAKSFELRAATCLARLWYDQGNSTAAFDLLEPIYGWFTEGVDMPDLKDSKALLNKLK